MIAASAIADAVAAVAVLRTPRWGGVLVFGLVLEVVFFLFQAHSAGQVPGPARSLALVVIAWVMFGVNIFATIATRKYTQMYVSLWYIMGTILWTAFVYITGNFAVEFTTGTNQANLMYRGPRPFSALSCGGPFPSGRPRRSRRRWR